MKKSWIENIIAGSYAIALHIIIIVLLVVGLGPSEETPAPPKVDIIQATVLDETTFDNQVKNRQQQQLLELKRKEEERLAKLEQERLGKEEKQRQEAERRKQEELKHKAEQEKKLAEQKRLEEQKKAEELKQKKIAEEKKRKEEEERQRKEEQKRKAEEEKKRKAEEERKRKEEAERKRKEQERKAAEERKRKEEAERKRREEEQLLKEALAAEEQEREANRVASVVGQYSAIIKQRVKRYWIKPASAQSGLQCTLQVELLPGGDVRRVAVVKSSGIALFDRSAETAVYKAAPLPLPSDVKAAAKFRRFQFIFKPE